MKLSVGAAFVLRNAGEVGWVRAQSGSIDALHQNPGTHLQL